MTDLHFPSTIRKPNIGDYSEDTIGLNRMTEMESGKFRTRPANHFATTTIHLSWRSLPQSEYVALYSFFSAHVSDEFLYAPATGGDEIVCRFLADTFAFTAVSNNGVPGNENRRWHGSLDIITQSDIGRQNVKVYNAQGALVSAGNVYSGTISAGQTAYVSRGGVLSGASILSGARVSVFSSGKMSNCKVSSGAVTSVFEYADVVGGTAYAGAVINKMETLTDQAFQGSSGMSRTSCATISGNGAHVAFRQFITKLNILQDTTAEVSAGGSITRAYGSGTLIVKKDGSVTSADAGIISISGTATRRDNVSGTPVAYTTAFIASDGVLYGGRYDSLTINAGGTAYGEGIVENNRHCIYANTCTVVSGVLSKFTSVGVLKINDGKVNGGGALVCDIGSVSAPNVKYAISKARITGSAILGSQGVVNGLKFVSGANINGIDIIASGASVGSGFIALSGVVSSGGVASVYAGQLLSKVTFSSGCTVNNISVPADFVVSSGALSMTSAAFTDSLRGQLFSGQSIGVVSGYIKAAIYDGGEIDSVVNASGSIMGDGRISLISAPKSIIVSTGMKVDSVVMNNSDDEIYIGGSVTKKLQVNECLSCGISSGAKISSLIVNASHTWANYEGCTIRPDALVVSAVVNSGASMRIMGSARLVEVKSGGHILCNDCTIDTWNLSSGARINGFTLTESNSLIPGSISSCVVSDGSIGHVMGGLSMVNSCAVSSNGVLSVYSQKTLGDVTISKGGSVIVMPRGSALGTNHIKASGVIEVSSGASMESAIVSSGGSFILWKGAACENIESKTGAVIISSGF